MPPTTRRPTTSPTRPRTSKLRAYHSIRERAVPSGAALFLLSGKVVLCPSEKTDRLLPAADRLSGQSSTRAERRRECAAQFGRGHAERDGHERRRAGGSLRQPFQSVRVNVRAS